MKRLIDKRREGPGSASVPDGKPIVRMLVLDDRLFLITATSVFQAQMADEIDPERMNAAIPQVVQHEELAYGTSDKFVRSTLSATGELLRDGTHLPQGFNLAAGQRLAIETARELAAISDEIAWLKGHQKEIDDGLAAGRWNRAFIPRTQNLKGRCDQGIAHLRQSALNLISLAELFYPKARQNLPWRQSLEGALNAHLAPGDAFLAVFQEIADDLEAMIHHRNAAVHPDNTKWVRYRDYELSAADEIVAPTLEVIHPLAPVARRDLTQFLQTQFEKLVEAYGTVLSVCCDRNARQLGPFETNVALTDPKSEADSPFRWVTRVRDGEVFPATAN